MNNEELKEALFGKFPVIVKMASMGDIECKCVSGIIYRVRDGKLAIAAEVMDGNCNSVMIVDPKTIRKKEV